MNNTMRAFKEGDLVEVKASAFDLLTPVQVRLKYGDRNGGAKDKFLYAPWGKKYSVLEQIRSFFKSKRSFSRRKEIEVSKSGGPGFN